MERETGIEPATSSLGSWRSTAELLPPITTLRLEILRCAQDFGWRLPLSALRLAHAATTPQAGVLPLNYSRSFRRFGQRSFAALRISAGDSRSALCASLTPRQRLKLAFYR